MPSPSDRSALPNCPLLAQPPRPPTAVVRALGQCAVAFPLLCPLCGAEMQIIAFITDGPTVRSNRVAW